MIEIRRKMNARPPRNVENLVAPLFEGEAHAHKFVIEPMDGVSFAGYSVAAIFVNAEGNNVQPESWLDEDGNANVVLTPTCYAKEGKYKLTIFVTKTETVNNEDKTTTVCVFACQGVIVNTLGRDYQGEIIAPTIEPYPDARIDSLTDTVSGLSTTVTGLTGTVDGLNTAAMKAIGWMGESYDAATIRGVTLTPRVYPGYMRLTISGTAEANAMIRIDKGHLEEMGPRDDTSDAYLTTKGHHYAMCAELISGALGDSDLAFGFGLSSALFGDHISVDMGIANSHCPARVHIMQGVTYDCVIELSVADVTGLYNHIEGANRRLKAIQTKTDAAIDAYNHLYVGNVILTSGGVNEDATFELRGCDTFRLDASSGLEENFATLTIADINRLLGLLATYGAISQPLTNDEISQLRTLLANQGGGGGEVPVDVPTEVVDDGGGSSGDDGSEPPAEVPAEDPVVDTGTEDPTEEPPA